MTSQTMHRSPVLKFLDFWEEILEGGERARGNTVMFLSYMLFFGLAWTVANYFSDKDYSSVLTAGSCFQCFAFYLLLHKTRVERSVAGISSRTLEMYILATCFRLVSTVNKNGYLPIDRSGDWVYQAADVGTILLALQVLYCMHKTHADTYQKEYDTMQVWRALPLCIVGGIVLHGDLNRSIFYDTCWAIGMKIDTLAMLPQLHMLVKKGGEVDVLSSNFVAMMFVGACCKLGFWWYGSGEFGEKQNKSAYARAAGFWVASCHVSQVLLSADFMFHYMNAGLLTYATGKIQRVNVGAPLSGHEI